MIKTYEEALAGLGIQHFNEIGLTTDEIAYKKLKIITLVLNDGWVPDWRDAKQPKYFPYFYNKGSFIVCRESYSIFTSVNATTNSGLYLKDGKTAEYAGKQFIELYKDFIL